MDFNYINVMYPANILVDLMSFVQSCRWWNKYYSQAYIIRNYETAQLYRLQVVESQHLEYCRLALQVSSVEAGAFSWSAFHSAHEGLCKVPWVPLPSTPPRHCEVFGQEVMAIRQPIRTACYDFRWDRGICVCFANREICRRMFL